MDQTTVILNQVLDQYSGSINNLQSGGISITQQLFFDCGLISIAVFGFNLLLRKAHDISDTYVELIKQLIYMIFLFGFISNFQAIFSTIFSWITDVSSYLGIQASHPSLNNAMSIQPINILALGITIAKKMLTVPYGLNIAKDLATAFLSVTCAATIIFCFATIGLELFLVQIGSQIILAGGIILLGFASLPWARDYAERYVHTFFHIGIKMIFIYILVGIGLSLAQNWEGVLKASNQGDIINTYLAIVMAAYVYYKLCLKVPDQAVSWLTGRLAMGFDTATDLKAGIKMVAAAPKMAVGMAHGATKIAANVTGLTKAIGQANETAKSNLSAQGVKDNGFNGLGETIKTLGTAYKHQTWDKKVADTLGSKMANDTSDGVLAQAGDAKAYATAAQAATAKFQAQGITPTAQQIKREANKTLSDTKWNKQVDETDGGKLAKAIVEDGKKSPSPTDNETNTDGQGI